MKKSVSALATVALLATATTASAVQVFTYTGSSAGAGSTLCPFIGCGAPPGDFVVTVTLDDLVTSIDHLNGGSVPGLVELSLDTDNGGGLTNFSTISDGMGNEDFAEFFINIIGGTVNQFGFALNQAAAPAPHGHLNADTSFTFGIVGPGMDPLGCDLSTGDGCLLIEDPFVTYVSGPFDASVIPVPAAAWLFGSALGLLVWVRRRA